MLQDLIVAATNDALRKAKETEQTGDGPAHRRRQPSRSLQSSSDHCQRTMQVIPPALERLIENLGPTARHRPERPRPGWPSTSSADQPRRPANWPHALAELHECDPALLLLLHLFRDRSLRHLRRSQAATADTRLRRRTTRRPAGHRKNREFFRGHYHILHGVLSPMDGIGPEEIKIRELLARVDSGTVKEVLIATSSTVPGEATASYLIDLLQGAPIQLTRLACGIPMGMDIKYADRYTLARAIELQMPALAETDRFLLSFSTFSLDRATTFHW